MAEFILWYVMISVLLVLGYYIQDLKPYTQVFREVGIFESVDLQSVKSLQCLSLSNSDEMSESETECNGLLELEQSAWQKKKSL